MRIRHLVVMLLAAVLAVITPGMMAPASAAGPGDVEGYVYDDDSGESIAGAEVSIAEDADLDGAPDGAAVATTTTDSDGYWTATVEEGSYVATITADGYFPSDLGFFVTGGDLTYAGDTYLALDTSTFGTLKGKVTRGGVGYGDDCGHVEIYRAADETNVTTVHTVDGGNWSAEVPAGSYKVLVADDCNDSASVWAPNAADFASGATYVLAENGTISVPTVNLVKSGVITGVVRDASGAAIAAAQVCSYPADDEFDTISCDETNASGAYELHGHTTGSYKVLAYDWIGDYRSQWYANKADFASATPVAVTIGTTKAGVNFALALETPGTAVPAAFKGVVTDTAGKPVRGLNVTLYNAADGEWVDSATTRRNGSFQFDRDNVDAGTYKVAYQGYLSYDEQWASFESQWHSGKFSFAKATPVTLGASNTVTLAPARLVRLGSIKGVVTLPAISGATSSWRAVTVFDADGEAVDNADVADNGAFVLGGLKPGKYKVRAHGERWKEDANGNVTASYPFIRQWWKGKYTEGTATPVGVTAGGTTAGIAITLGRSLVATANPAISGTPKKGKKLTASLGSWNRVVDTVFTITWKRGATVVGTGPTYKVAKKDRGKKITVTVTAKDRNGDLATGAATSKAVKIKKGKKKK